MKTLLPIDTEGDSAAVHDALAAMYVRVARLARKRPSPLDIMIGPASVGLIAAFDRYYGGQTTAAEMVTKIDSLYADRPT